METNGEESEPLSNESRGDWGSIEDVVNAPLIGVEPNESWCCVFLFYLFLPLNLLMGIISGACNCIYTTLALTGCCSSYKATMSGNPCYTFFIKAWYEVAMGVMLGKNGGVRLDMFRTQWKAFGSEEYFWQGGGLWCTTYDAVQSIVTSEQARWPAFACLPAVAPDIFPPGLLIFLPNVGQDSEWWVVRQALHKYFLDMGTKTYNDRVAQLPGQIAEDWPNPRLAHLDDVPRLQRMVCKYMFYVLCGEWITDDEAEILRGWRSLAAMFVLPRFAQRLMFNHGIGKVKELRIQTIGIAEKYGLQGKFEEVNESLGKYKRTPTVKLADEFMYIFGFAGYGGTSALVETASAFLQLKMPHEASKSTIDLSLFETSEDMIDVYLENPEAYLKEAGRINPSVTSATAPFDSDTTVSVLDNDYDMPEGSLRQYALSMANRDESVFTDPDVFNPRRDPEELNRSFTWNGCFMSGASPQQEEATYPRICPGRYLSLTVAKTILDHAVNSPSVLNSESEAE